MNEPPHEYSNWIALWCWATALSVFLVIKTYISIVRLRKKKRCDPYMSMGEEFFVNKSLKYETLFFITASIVLSVSGLTVLFSWLVDHGDDILYLLSNEFGQSSVKWVTGFSVICLGGIGFFFRRRRQLEYGVIELIFGACVSIVSLSHFDRRNFLNTLVTLGGCVYIVVRGFTNMHDGWETKEKRKRAEWERLMERIRESDMRSQK
jgi:hypothetical protein